MVSDLIESHSPVFFSARLRFVFQLKRMQKTRRRLLQSVVERAKQKKPIVFPNNETSEASAFCSLLSNAPSKRNLLFSRTMKPAKRPVAGCFLHTFLLENEAQTSGKKYRAVTFY